MQTTINLRTLKAVNLAASTEEVRYYLRGVYVECRADHVIYSATNGNVLLCARENLPELEVDAPARLVGNFIIPSESIKAIKLASRADESRDKATFEVISHGAAHGMLGDARVTFVDGTFPDWRRVVPGKPEPQPNNPAHFNFHLLGMFSTFAKAMGWAPLDARLHHCRPGNPHAVTFGPERQAFGVIMPARHPADSWSGRPDWAA
jgi:hypothetical protein